MELFKKKSFGLWSAIFLGIGSMVGSGIFVLLGEAGAIAGNLVWVSFILGGIVALLSGYSLAKLANAYPSKGGVVDYLVQCYGEGVFSGTISILFYISGMVALAMVAKTFGTYAGVIFGIDSQNYINYISLAILFFFVIINLNGSSLMAKSENIIVIIKLSILIFFTIISYFYLDPKLLILSQNYNYFGILQAIGLTFFAYEGFRVITNTVEDIENPEKNILKAMMISISLVIILYLGVTIAVFGTLPLEKIIQAKDYALAEAVKPAFGQLGFTIMALAALISTSSSINANLYAITNVTYSMAVNGELPKIYKKNFLRSNEGILISAIIISNFILFFDLGAIASIGAIAMLFIHLLVHIGHLLKIKKTKANIFLVLLAIITIFSVIIIAYNYSSKHINNLGLLFIGAIFVSFIIEITLRFFTGRVVKKY